MEKGQIPQIPETHERHARVTTQRAKKRVCLRSSRDEDPLQMKMWSDVKSRRPPPPPLLQLSPTPSAHCCPLPDMRRCPLQNTRDLDPAPPPYIPKPTQPRPWTRAGAHCRTQEIWIQLLPLIYLNPPSPAPWTRAGAHCRTQEIWIQLLPPYIPKPTQPRP